MHALNRQLRESDDVVQLKVTAYDRVSSLLVALLIFCGFGVATLFLLWLVVSPLDRHRDFRFVEFDEAGGSATEIAELEQPAVTELLTGATEEVSTDLSAVAQVAELVGQDESLFTQPIGPGTTTIRGHGPGDGPGNGPYDLKGIIPRGERWAIRLEARSLAEYAALLDYFHIELGALGGGSRTIHYASQFSSSQPAVRIGEPKDEQRLYMTWRSGELKARDEQLLSQAGVEVENKVLVQFYPSETEKQLAFLERERAGDRPVAEIRRTTFGVRPNSKVFDFYVISQIYR